MTTLLRTLGSRLRGSLFQRADPAAQAAPTTVNLAEAPPSETDMMSQQEKGEAMYQKKFGVDPFDCLYDHQNHFGTLEKPVPVYSRLNFRYVACTGGIGHDEHQLLWFTVREGPVHRCPTCGQAFKHTKTPDTHFFATGGHH